MSGRPRCRLATLGALALLSLALAAPAWAHGRSVSYSTWTIRGAAARVELRTTALDRDALLAAAGGAQALHAWLPRQLRLEGRTGVCGADAASLRELAGPVGQATWEWRVDCAAQGGPVRVHVDLLVDVAPSHLHIVRLVVHTATSGAPLEAPRTAEHALAGGHRLAALPAPEIPAPTRLAALVRYLELGARHVWSGWDHLAFLLVLALIAGSLGELARAVTGFTLGHSVTLALAVLGWIAPATGLVEALIALSIALVAVENVWLAEGRRGVLLPVGAVAAVLGTSLALGVRGTAGAGSLVGMALLSGCGYALLGRAARPARLRGAFAALFGTLHGLGFAGALRELAPAGANLVVPLLGFNLGVELGQLAVLALAWPLIVLVMRRGPAARLALVRWGSAAAAGAGTFWFVTRLFG